MGFFFVYILKSGVCLSLFYLFYRLLLSKETFYRFNRIALLGILVFSLLLPLIEVTKAPQNEINQAVLTIEQLLVMAENHQETQVTTVVEGDDLVDTWRSPVHWIEIVLLFYIAGIFFLVCRNVYSLFRLVRLMNTAQRRQIDKHTVLLVHDRNVAPFSWMKFVVISRTDLEENGREILIHECAHIRKHHSWDLLIADICIFFQWFNPGAWLLKQELQNIHEYEADEAVINEGINARDYQLLLIKKAVGTRLYSMANSFNHSKLKKRITMMLKEKSNPWARLKLLLAVPVMAGALYVFAQPEVKEVPRQIQSELQQKEADDYSSLMFFFKEGGERYSKLVNGAYPPSKIKARQVHSLFVNKQNRVMFDNDVCSVDELKSTIVKNLMKSWEESKRKEYQVISFQVDRGSEIAALTTILKEVKGAFEQIRADLSITLTDKSEEALDRLFPVLLSEGAARNYGLKELSMEEKISGIVVTIHTSEGKEVMKDFTLTELKQKVTAARAKQADPESLVIGLKIEKGCKMGYVTDTKQVLRECSALKINYSTDN